MGSRKMGSGLAFCLSGAISNCFPISKRQNARPDPILKEFFQEFLGAFLDVVG